MKEREDQERRARIARRAHQIWEQEGRPEGRSQVHWDMASELVAIEDNQKLATAPVPPPGALGPTGEPVEPLIAVENAGEFPTLTDQGDESYQIRRRGASAADGAARPKAAAVRSSKSKSATTRTSR